MHVLRSTYLPSYASLIRPPYTSDPFPTGGPAADSPAASPVLSLQRETRVLDLFIVLKVREDVWADESDLHLEREESFRDLFDLMQPRARVEDLVGAYGAAEGVVAAGRPRPPGGAVRWRLPAGKRPVPLKAISASFSQRRVALALTTLERKKTIVEVSRTRDESLESSAKKLVKELRIWIMNSH